MLLYGATAHASAERAATSAAQVNAFAVVSPAILNVRKGPGKDYKVLFVITKQHLPLEVLLKYEGWYKIKDHEGVEGWVKQGTLSFNRKKRSVFFKNNDTPLYSSPQKGRIKAKAQKGVLAKIISCDKNFCQVSVDKITGWSEKKYLWGVYPQELIKSSKCFLGLFCK